jgi:hypothetical protein
LAAVPRAPADAFDNPWLVAVGVVGRLPFSPALDSTGSPVAYFALTVPFSPSSDTLLLEQIYGADGGDFPPRSIGGGEVQLSGKGIGLEPARVGDDVLEQVLNLLLGHPGAAHCQPSDHPTTRIDGIVHEVMQHQLGIVAAGIVVRQDLAPSVPQDDFKLPDSQPV